MGVPAVSLDGVAKPAVGILVAGKGIEHSFAAAVFKVILKTCQIQRTGIAIHEGTGFLENFVHEDPSL